MNNSTMTPNSTQVANLAHYLTRNAHRLTDQIAIVQDEKTWTWAEFDSRVSALCKGLVTEFNVTKGDRIAVQLNNSNRMLEVMMAAFRLGAVWCPSNFRNGTEELAYQCEKSNASALIVEASFTKHIELCEKSVPNLILVNDAIDSYNELIARHLGCDFPNTPVDRDDPCWMFFTSGSTGKPKASVLTQGQMGFTVLNHLNDLMPGTSEKDASLVVAPLSHGSGMHQITQIAAGAKSVLLSGTRFDPEEAWKLVQQWKVSNMFTVPTIVKMLVEHPAVMRFDHSSLRYVVYAGAPMYREDQKRALKTIGKVLVQYYGLGEVTGAITVLKPDDHHVDDGPNNRSGTCGIERSGIMVSIQDEAGNCLGPHQTGEICVIGSAVFPGYFLDPEANAKSFRSGWFRTGDIGHMDAERYVYITGRASDMYISGGSNVYPREIEEVLLSHPALKEVAIIGVPHPKWGEVGVAACVFNERSDVTANELTNFLKDKVATYKQPFSFVFVDELPKSTVGKVTKKLLKEELTVRGLLPEFGI